MGGISSSNLPATPRLRSGPLLGSYSPPAGIEASGSNFQTIVNDRSRLDNNMYYNRCYSRPTDMPGLSGPSALDKGKVIEANDSNFQALINDKSKPLTVVCFYASWCPVCRRITPKIIETSKVFDENTQFLSVDVDKCGNLREKYGVEGMPTVLFFKNGEVVGERLQNYRTMIKSIEDKIKQKVG